MAIQITQAEKEQIIEFDGVKLTCKPYTAEVYQIARAKAQKIIQELKEARSNELEMGVRPTIPDLSDIEILTGMLNHLLAIEMAKYAIKSWEGVVVEDEKPAELTDDNITMLFQDGQVQDQFFMQYQRTHRRIQSEKK